MESKIQSDLIKQREADGWYVVKLIATNRNGIGDLLCLKHGQAEFVEVKRPGHKREPLQKARAAEIFAATGVNTLVYCGDRYIEDEPNIVYDDLGL